MDPFNWALVRDSFKMAKSVAKRLLPWLRTVGGVLLLRWLGARLLTALLLGS